MSTSSNNDVLSEEQTAQLVVELLCGLEHVSNPDKIVNAVCCFLSLYYYNSSFSLNELIDLILEHKTTVNLLTGNDHGDA